MWNSIIKNWKIELKRYMEIKLVLQKKMGLSERSVSLKLTGVRQWTQSEIYKAKELLKIEDKEIVKYFFIRNS